MKKTSNAGFATTEFLFAIVIAFGMTSLVFAVTFTLTVVEATQYVVYSAARAHAAGNLDPEAQAQAARAKYRSLVQDPTMAPLFQNGWFSISSPQDLDVRNGRDGNFERDYPSSGNRQVFTGVRTNFRADVLEMRLPLIGSVTPEGNGFETRIGAFLIREPTHKECVDFMKERQNRIWELGGGRFNAFKTNTDIAVPWEDNGC